MKTVRVELQSGERIEALNEERIASILRGLHPENSARATFYADDGEWVSVSGCVSDGFAFSRQATPDAAVVYCPRMISFSEAQGLIARFVRGELEWLESVPWKRTSRIVQLGIVLLVLVVVASILFFFVRGLRSWL